MVKWYVFGNVFERKKNILTEKLFPVNNRFQAACKKVKMVTSLKSEGKSEMSTIQEFKWTMEVVKFYVTQKAKILEKQQTA